MMNALHHTLIIPACPSAPTHDKKDDEIGHKDSKAGANGAGLETEGRNEYLYKYELMHENC